jgi:hypothetical protein
LHWFLLRTFCMRDGLLAKHLPFRRTLWNLLLGDEDQETVFYFFKFAKSLKTRIRVKSESSLSFVNKFICKCIFFRLMKKNIIIIN